MIKKISINHFRGIEHVVLNDLQRISVITGRNNTGKSTLLEAVFFLLEHTAANSFLDLNALRGAVSTGTQIVTSLFHGLGSIKAAINSCVDEL